MFNQNQSREKIKQGEKQYLDNIKILHDTIKDRDIFIQNIETFIKTKIKADQVWIIDITLLLNDITFYIDKTQNNIWKS